MFYAKKHKCFSFKFLTLFKTDNAAFDLAISGNTTAADYENTYADNTTNADLTGATHADDNNVGGAGNTMAADSGFDGNNAGGMHGYDGYDSELSAYDDFICLTPDYYNFLL